MSNYLIIENFLNNEEIQWPMGQPNIGPSEGTRRAQGRAQ